jgi:ribosomal protein S18 acetylase RimI-like enzyme
VVHLVTTSNPLSVAVAGPEDMSTIEPAWWRLLNHQQGLDCRGSANELRSPTNAERVRRFLESRIRQERMLVARCEGELVGICTFSPDGFILDAPTQIWEIADVWVEPHARRRGIATALVRQCEHECKMRGADEVRLTVYAMNDGALGLYQSLGYDVSSYTLSRNLNPTG